MYSIAGNAQKYAKDYHDITRGGCNAGTGYDFPTGLGTSVAYNLVPMMHV